jgi:hypothetical protein
MKQTEYDIAQAITKDVVGGDLISNDEDERGNPIYTSTKTGLWIQQDYTQEIVRKTIGGDKPTGKFPWAVWGMKETPGGYWDPPSHDEVELGRADYLVEAVNKIAHLQLEWELRNALENSYDYSEIGL